MALTALIAARSAFNVLFAESNDTCAASAVKQPHEHLHRETLLISCQMGLEEWVCDDVREYLDRHLPRLLSSDMPPMSDAVDMAKLWLPSQLAGSSPTHRRQAYTGLLSMSVQVRVYEPVKGFVAILVPLDLVQPVAACLLLCQHDSRLPSSSSSTTTTGRWGSHRLRSAIDIILLHSHGDVPTSLCRGSTPGFPSHGQDQHPSFTDDVQGIATRRSTEHDQDQKVDHHLSHHEQEQHQSMSDMAQAIAFRSQQYLSRVPGTCTFRVSATRAGQHSFNHVQLAAAVGEAVGQSTGLRARMKGFDINIRVDVVGSRYVAGQQLNTDELTRRSTRTALNRVTTRSNIAYLMLRQAKLQPGQTVLDPFCGSGTILLEAADIFPGQLRCIGLDTNMRAIRGAEANVRASNHSAVCHVAQGDARNLDKHHLVTQVTSLPAIAPRQDASATSALQQPHQARIDAIVTNAPWGVQTGQNEDLKELYALFLVAAARVLKRGGRLVAFVLRGMLFLDVLRRTSRFRLVAMKVVRTRNNLPTIFVLENLEADPDKTELSLQLRQLTPYVDLAGDMFWDLHGRDQQRRHRPRPRQHQQHQQQQQQHQQQQST